MAYFTKLIGELINNIAQLPPMAGALIVVNLVRWGILMWRRVFSQRGEGEDEEPPQN